VEFGRAFHSIYFEMLGEQGYPGLAMFLLITGVSFYRLGRVRKKARAHPELGWVTSLADALQSGLAVFMTCGAFVGIAFQPMFWYFIAMSISLNAYMWRVENQEAKPQAGWRRMAAPAASFPPAQAGVSGWRGRLAGSGLPAAKPPR
jgi:putative inorganic carbon (hco3(-)) transporter